MQEKIKGITKCRSKIKPWRAYIGYGKTFKHLGNYETMEEAINARLKAEKGIFPNNVVSQKTIDELASKYQEKEAWFIRVIKAFQKRFNLPSSAVKVALAPLEK